ncbi:MAG: efflux RND transporter periplasmic adaptor subunit [Ferruginibacter sp.]|nr:efflux RND transporter periplasmic adaptor subunit [Ferruginibacter sp.]
MKYIIAILIISLMLFACKSKTTSIEKTATITNENVVTLTDAQFKNANIETTILEEKNIATILKLNGKIDVPPQNLVSVSVPLGGYLRNTKLLPGMHISKGEVIAVMEDQQYIQLQQDYLSAKSKLHFAELEYKRQKELNQSQASSDKITQQALAEVNIQRITMNATAEKLRLINKNPASVTVNNISKTTNVYSSINGYVSKVNVNIGKYITPADVMFELINPADIHLNVKVFEKDIAKLSIGQKVIAYDNAHPDKKYNCEIILISKDITPEGTADVHCHFENYNQTILPGMYMNAEVQVATSASNTLPEESIVTFEGKEFVFAETKKHQFEIIEVTTGTKENGFVSITITEALKNKTIVTKGAYTLLMKMKNKEE